MERNFCNGASNIYNISSDEKENIVSLDKRRYIILCILGASLFCTGESFVTFGYGYAKNESSENSVTENKAMDLFGILFLMSYAATAIVCPLIFKKIGMRWIVLLGCSLNVFGVGLRIIYVSISSQYNGNNSELKLVENIVLGCSMGLLSSLSTLVAILWFGMEEQDMSNDIPLFATSFGIGVGFMNICIFKGYNVTANQVRTYLICQIIWELVMNALVILCAYFLITPKPRNYPSHSEMERCKNKNIQDWSAEIKNMINISKKIFSNLRSCLSIVITSINHGTYIVFFLFIFGLIDTFKESAMTFKFCAVYFCVFLGIEIMLLFTCIKFKSLNFLSSPLTGILLLIFSFPLLVYLCFFKKEENNFNINATIALFICFLVLAPSSISFGFQNLGIFTYPSDPNITSSFVLSIGNLFGILLMLLLQFVGIRSNYVIFICLAVGIPSIIFIRLEQYVPRGFKSF